MSDETQIQVADDASSENYEDLFGEFFHKQEEELPPPPPSGGFMRICPKISCSVKDNNKLVRLLCADDADDPGANFLVAPKFRKKTILFAPVTHAFGHEGWNGGKKVVDNPGSLDNCEFCLVNAESDNEMDRCENHSKLVFYVIDTKEQRDPKKWEIQGLYHIDMSSKTTFDEPYNFFFHEMLPAVRDRKQAPFAKLYRMTTVTREKQFTWNIARIVREQDNIAEGSFYRESGREKPVYASMETPENILKEIAALLKPGEPASFAVRLFQLKGSEAFEKMQERLSGRPVLASGDKAKAAVTAGKAVAKPAAASGDGVDAFLGVD